MVYKINDMKTKGKIRSSGKLSTLAMLYSFLIIGIVVAEVGSSPKILESNIERQAMYY